MAFKIKVNGVDRAADVDGDTLLLWVLRDVFRMTDQRMRVYRVACPVDQALLPQALSPDLNVKLTSLMSIETISISRIGRRSGPRV